MSASLGFGKALALAALMALAGCSSSGNTGSDEPSMAATDATAGPDQGAIGVQPGTEQDFMVNVGRRTFFKQGSAELDDTARVTLDKQAEWLNQHSHWKVKLQGFADDSGSAAQQTALSQKRADSVRDYLGSRGVASSRMLAKGYGRERLVGDCADIECKAQNRRVITNPQENPEF